VTYLALDQLAWMVPLAVGISYVLTCSVIGYWPRFVWCALLKWHPATRYWWNILTCPTCNAWWSGLAVTLAYGSGLWPHGVQVAFTSCGVMAALQARYGWQAGEDMEVVFGLKEPSDGQD
jgi:hypothetical protein